MALQAQYNIPKYYIQSEIIRIILYRELQIQPPNH